MYDNITSLLSNAVVKFDNVLGFNPINDLSNASDSLESLAGRDAVVKKLENSSWADLSSEEQLLYLYG